ncbi:hypothetical protein TIFTF001_013181 [Ficus carica]|uniref:Uncharacterized protein n=1 Tax=Ficus carica TaxID=3494 RepID=A0AA88DI78_FICCA|nr:hypothetical protein TIFTF001_013181 [Ficus carica]
MASTARRGSELSRSKLRFLRRRHPPTHRPHRKLVDLTSRSHPPPPPP